MAGFIPSDNVRRGLSRAQGRDELLLDTGYGRVKDLFRFGAKGFQRILSQLLLTGDVHDLAFRRVSVISL